MVDLIAPAEVEPARAYKPEYTDEDAIRKELAKLGDRIRTGARDLEGTKFAACTRLAADYVDLKIKATNDRASIKEADIRTFIKKSIGYGDGNGRVAAEHRSSTIEALLAVSAKAAFLYHHGFNGCDIRWFVGNEPAKEGDKGAVARISMPFMAWMPKVQTVGQGWVDNPEKGHRPLPQWAINSQYRLMIDKEAKLGQDGRVMRPPREGDTPFERQVRAVDAAVKKGEFEESVVRTAAAMLTAALRRNEPVLRNESIQDVLVGLLELLDRRLEETAEEAEVKQPTRKRA